MPSQNIKMQKIFPTIEFVSQEDFKTKYAHDATENLNFPIHSIALPKNSQEVSQLVQYCFENKLPIFPRGAGTGLVGGSLATEEGLMISLEKMNRIEKIDAQNFTITVEAGVINHDLQEALAPYGLFYPPDPSSWQSCFIGGNIATNAGGPRAVKYGVTAHWVLNLEVVLPNGEIIWTGANTLKNATTYNLTQLYIGSEGTLGIVTKAVLKVIKKPTFEYTMLVPFKNLHDSASAVAIIFQEGMNPSTFEFIERNALLQMQKFNPEDVVGLYEDTQAQLLISYDGNEEEEIFQQMEKTYELLSQFPIDEPFMATTESEKNRIWRTRRKLAEVVKANGFTIEEDTVVPRSKLPELVEYAHSLEEKYHIQLVCYGHAGDGNLHIRIHHPKHEHSYKNEEVQIIIEDLFHKVQELGGTISAEHGIGIIQKKYLPIVLSQENLSIQKAIKNAIDPKGIMNPDKIF